MLSTYYLMGLSAVRTAADGFGVTLNCLHLTVVGSVAHPKLCHAVVTAHYQRARHFLLNKRNRLKTLEMLDMLRLRI